MRPLLCPDCILRLGSDELRRPVEAAAIAKEVWIDPFRGLRQPRRRIGRFEFRKLAPGQYFFRHFVALGGEPLQNLCAGGIGSALAFLAAFEAHLIEKDLAELLGEPTLKSALPPWISLRSPIRLAKSFERPSSAWRSTLAFALHLGDHRDQWRSSVLDCGHPRSERVVSVFARAAR